MAAPMAGAHSVKSESFSLKTDDFQAENGEMNVGGRKCGCKGIRTCLLCEKSAGIQRKFTDFDELRNRSRMYCVICRSSYPACDWPLEAEGEELEAWHAQHHNVPRPPDADVTLWPRPPDGIHLRLDFVSEEEERHLVEQINAIPWAQSQSGRLKQDFGPKVNFKKRKVRFQDFKGFPDFVQFLLKRFSKDPHLRDFRPIELCHLNYDPSRGSSIEPHLDDAWLWGERLVTLSLGAPTVLTLTFDLEGHVLRVPLPRRSLLVLEGDARHTWKHAIYRQDVKGQRVALTFRELSLEFGPGGAQEAIGLELIKRAESVCTLPSSQP